MASFKEHFYPEFRFGGFAAIDGTVAFYTRVRALMKPTDVVLDIGCGVRDNYHNPYAPLHKELYDFRGRCARQIGIDVDPAAAANPLIDEFHLLEGDRWPVEDNSIDLAMADFVIEHVENPTSFFSELGRVVKKGGYFCARTPNVLSYFGIAAKFAPRRMHGRLGVLAKNREKEQGFPTYYRCNTARSVRKYLKAAGFGEVCVMHHESTPAYLNFSRLAYRMGVWYGRYAPRMFRTGLLIYARKTQ